MQDQYFKDDPIDISDIQISVYCGTYKGYIALRFIDNKNLTSLEGEEIVDNFKLIYPYKGGNTVILWKQN